MINRLRPILYLVCLCNLAQAQENPFDFWIKRERKPKQKISFQADLTGSYQNLEYFQSSDKPSYGGVQQLAEFYLTLSPPPPPRPRIDTQTILIPAPPVNTAPLYNSLLSYLQAGPGPAGLGTLGTRINVGHLQQITPALMNLASVFIANPGMSFNQLLSTPQGNQVINAVFPILQPLGMWNLSTLTAWRRYVIQTQNQLQQTLLTLHSQLLLAQVIPPPISQTITTVTHFPAVNPFEVIEEIKTILKSGKAIRKEFGRLRNLVHSLIRHEGFSEPQIILFGSRSGRKIGPWPYKVAIITEREIKNRREVHVLTEEGNYFVNQYPSGAEYYWVGPDDASLVYLNIDYRNEKVKTLDVRASNEYAWFKRASGGDLDLLDRASTFSTSLISVDVGFLENNALHLRAVAGSTPRSALGGVMGEVELGDKEELVYWRAGGGPIFQDLHLSHDSNFLGYLETELYTRTPYLESLTENPETGEQDRGFRTWISLTAGASGLAHRPLTPTFRRNKEVDAKWGFQAELRVIPELHAQLVTPYSLLETFGGVTTALVPGGKVDLSKPEKSLGIYPIRFHVGTKIKLRLSKIIDLGQRYNWVTKELETRTEPIEESLFLELGFIIEFSAVVTKARISNKLEWNWIFIEALMELEYSRISSWKDVRVGAGVGCFGITASYLHSLEEKDFRLQVGFDLNSFLASVN